MKKWLGIGLGFGAGAVLMTGLLVVGITWYSNRPKAWNTEAIRASFSADLYDIDADCNITGMQLEYLLENRKSEDYTLSPEERFMIASADGLGPSVTGHYKVEKACFVPSGNKVKCSITVPTDYDVEDKSLTGFVVFDSSTRYQINFPRPLRPTGKQRLETVEHFAKLKASGSQACK